MLNLEYQRNNIFEWATTGTTIHGFVQRTFLASGPLQCEARRMNPATFGSLPSSACTLGAQGTGSNDFGPDRITRNVYDAAGQLLQVQRGYGTSLQQNYATYTYSPNGRRRTVTDANGNAFGRRQTQSSIATGAVTATSTVAYDDVSRL